MDCIIVDIQGFRTIGNEFVCKELSVVSASEDDAMPYTYLFKPPCSWDDLPAKWKAVNLWLERNHHGLPWDYGHIPYDQLPHILMNLARRCKEDIVTVYVKGLEKMRWFENYFDDVHNLEDHGCPPLNKIVTNPNIKCTNHVHGHPTYNCAVRNVLTLKRWLIFLEDNAYVGQARDIAMKPYVNNNDDNDPPYSLPFSRHRGV